MRERGRMHRKLDSTLEHVLIKWRRCIAQKPVKRVRAWLDNGTRDDMTVLRENVVVLKRLFGFASP